MIDTVLNRYLKQVELGHFHYDKKQHQALLKLNSAYQCFKNKPQWWYQYFKPTPKQPSYYLVGDVGRGKTWIMDNFYQSVNISKKRRWHFYSFLSFIQTELQRIKGQTNPLQQIAQQLLNDYQLLCLDEFFINHIKEAMLIRGIFEHLLSANILLIMTSNTLPKQLYQQGIQKQQFLPVIKLLQQQMQVLDLGNQQDYRQKYQQKHYYYPLKPPSHIALKNDFKSLIYPEIIYLNQQPLSIMGQTKLPRCIWVNFTDLCQTNLSELDYLLLAQKVDRLILANIPQLSSTEDDQARRLISLIDILYDHAIKLYISAAVAIDKLYIGSNLAKDFKRTQSRLKQMTADIV